MYIGGTGSDGLMHLLWELIDNAVDEAAAGHCDRVLITLHRDGSMEVRDNGRGIPVGKHKKRKVSALEVVLTELHAGGKFGGGAYGASGGLHGVGASVVNALSAKLIAEVDVQGNTHRLCFKRAGRGPVQRQRRIPGQPHPPEGQEDEEDRHHDPVLARPRGLRPRGRDQLRHDL